jgi:Na+/H+ antiporter NhaD/arsenite permease-like protein
MEEQQNSSKGNKFSSFIVTIFLIAFFYLVLVQPLISLFFQKDTVSSETVLVKVEKKESGNFDLGLLSKYKFK